MATSGGLIRSAFSGGGGLDPAHALQYLKSEPPKRRLRISRSSTISGRLRVQFGYDVIGSQLVVTILNAVELPPCASGAPRNTFCRTVLLPDKL